MLYIYIFLGLLQLFLAYMIYDALSFSVTSGKEMFRIFTCGYKENKKTDNFEPFEKSFEYCPSKFVSGVAFLGVFLPLVNSDYRDYNNQAELLDIFLVIGGVSLYMLWRFAVDFTGKRIKTEFDIFNKFRHDGNMDIQWNFLTEKQKSEIKAIALAGYYEYSKSWLTSTEKNILKDKDNYHERYLLIGIIENGFALPKLWSGFREVHPTLGIRSIDNDSQPELPKTLKNEPIKDLSGEKNGTV